MNIRFMRPALAYADRVHPTPGYAFPSRWARPEAGDLAPYVDIALNAAMQFAAHEACCASSRAARFRCCRCASLQRAISPFRCDEVDELLPRPTESAYRAQA
jgi:hypothetical protein